MPSGARVAASSHRTRWRQALADDSASRDSSGKNRAVPSERLRAPHDRLASFTRARQHNIADYTDS